MKHLDLSPAQIVVMPQVRERFDAESLAGLAQSMQQVGLQQPIRVRRHGDYFALVFGERRLRAAQQLGWTTIPAIVVDGVLSESDIAQQQLVENCQRVGLTPIELANGIDKLMKATSCPAAEAAAKIGLSSASVSKLLALLLLPKEVQARVHEGTLAASAAYEIAKVRDPEQRARLVAEALAGRLTRASVLARSVSARKGRPRSIAKRQRMPRAVVSLGSGREITVKGPGLTLGALTTWLEELLTKLRQLGRSDMDLDEAVQALSVERRQE